MRLIIIFGLLLMGCSTPSPTAPTDNTPYKVGDINHDGVVNQGDMDLLSAAFGSVPGAANWNADADIDNNGRVDGYDLITLSLNQEASWNSKN